jgi:dihydrofolate synthase/folylpolyglutamate synthase
VAVITSIGLDHTEILGGTIADIAWHKAGIIKAGSAVVHAVDIAAGVAAIERQAATVNAEILAAIDLGALSPRPEQSGAWSWLDAISGERLRSGLPGRIQALNAALAVAAARAWRADLPIDAIRRGLAATRFPARFERMPGRKLVILDGAHNPQKVAALVPEIAHLPRPSVGVLGFLAAKRADEMIAQLAPHLDEIVLTSPDVVGKPGLDVDGAVAMAKSLTGMPITGLVDPLAALDLAMERSGAEGSVLVSGSLFLCGAIRERWYASKAIVTQQTSWPEVGATPTGVRST